MEGALESLRRALASDGGGQHIRPLRDVSDLCIELPEAQIETAISSALRHEISTVPALTDIEAALAEKGQNLKVLKKRKRKYSTPKLRKVHVPKRRDELEPELLLGFSSREGRELFQVLSKSDPEETLARLVAESCGGGQVTHNTFKVAKVGLGRRYVVSHGEGCVHRVVLTRISLWTKPTLPDHNVSQEKLTRQRKKTCDICAAFTATTVVLDEPRCEERKRLLFCDQCLHMFYYDHNGFVLPTTLKFFPL